MDTSALIKQPPLSATEPESSPEARPVPAEQHETVICPSKGWQLLNVRELWRFRELLYFLTWRDIKVRYKQTALGAAWAVLQPAMMMVVFTVFFRGIAKVPAGNLPYPLYVFAGLLPWSFFATSIANAGNSVVGSERLITKIYFPRLAIPFASVGAAIVDFCIATTMLIGLMLYYAVFGGIPINFTAEILLAPLIFALIVLAATGVGTLMAALNAAYRDFRYVIPFLVQLWLFATPTVYMDPFQNNPGTRMQVVLWANPVAGLIGAFRAAMLGLPVPWTHLFVSAFVSVMLFVAGCFYFRRVEDSFADII